MKHEEKKRLNSGSKPEMFHEIISMAVGAVDVVGDFSVETQFAENNATLTAARATFYGKNSTQELEEPNLKNLDYLRESNHKMLLALGSFAYKYYSLPKDYPQLKTLEDNIVKIMDRIETKSLKITVIYCLENGK